MELGLVLRPDRLHGQHPFPQQGEAGGEVGAVVGHLLAVPAAADAEQEAAAGEEVDGGDLLGGDDGVPLDDEADARPEQEPFGAGGQRPEDHEGIGGAAELVGDAVAAGGDGLGEGGDVGVLGDEQRLEAAVLQRPAEGPDVDAVPGGEGADAEPHEAPLASVMALCIQDTVRCGSCPGRSSKWR